MLNPNNLEEVNYKISMLHTEISNIDNRKDDKDRSGDAGINCPCHSLSEKVPSNNKHVLRHPRVIPIFWGHFYVTNPHIVAATIRMLSDIVSGPYMNGLAQYGVSRGTVLGHHTIDTVPPNSDPLILDRDTVRNTLVSWINSGTVSPAPAVNEKSLIYIIFLPTGSNITDSGAAGYHNFAKFNQDSFEDDLFWAVIVTKGNDDPTSAVRFANNIAYITSHELNEAFTDCDNQGFTTAGGCEIGDICESRDPTCSCCTKFNYNVKGRTWQIEPYWSNWHMNCINGNEPVSIRMFLKEIGINPSDGLRQLGTLLLNIDYIASRM